MPLTDFRDLLEQPDFLYEGQVALTEEWIVRSAINADTVIIAHGRGACFSANGSGLILPVDANSRFAGIAIESQARERKPGINVATDGRFGYEVNALFGYLIRGVIGVLVDQDVVKGQPAFCRFTAGAGISQKGVFRADNGGGTVIAIAVPDSRFLRSAPAGSVVPLSLNLA